MTNSTQHWAGARIRLGAANGALALVVVLGQVVVATQSAQAQTFTLLYEFTGGDGANPHAGLVGDTAGNLYGTTELGGDLACGDGYGCGTVFKLDATGQQTVLHSFSDDPDGAYPYAGLIRDGAGSLYGTTFYGGDYGSGTEFKLTPNTTGQYKVLHSFTFTDGGPYQPRGGLIGDPAGSLYGTTAAGGDSGWGTVFKLDATGKETVLYSFTDRADGGFPQGGLIRDAAGNLYSTTFNGGASRYGAVFKLDAAGKFEVLYSFTGGADGRQPYAGLIRDGAGNLYGATFYGGDYGVGTVFKLDAMGNETVLYSFTGGSDGAYPIAGLIRDPAGSLYGTTEGGGDYGVGTVFKVNAAGKLKVLHSFAGADGAIPIAGLIRDAAGNLYSTTYYGGDLNCRAPYGCGTVFKLAP